ncbi:hypothetical protein RN001_002121 [Aquatica leii]|uniref:Uncharacterized protein n=1 Tax=Aquatica leii TaxID=1421715 RepID=A0AAN7PCY3_9COLE|nr:hypothetical protein RN001_002121 [Aquatica leii]
MVAVTSLFSTTLVSSWLECLLCCGKKAWIDSLAENSSKSVDQLRKCLENMQARRKKDLANEKKQRMSTGGGKYVPPLHENIDHVSDGDKKHH